MGRHDTPESVLASAAMPDRDHLQTLLFTHVPRDPEEAVHRERMLQLVNHDGCFSRTLAEPGHFTASAFVLSPDREQTLLVFHGKLKRWLQPGGHVEASDPTILHAARREIAEEVGLVELPLATEGILDLDVHMIPPLKSDPAHEHFDVRFAFVARDLNFVAGDDALSARWFDLKSIDEATSDRSVMRAIEKLRA